MDLVNNSQTHNVVIVGLTIGILIDTLMGVKLLDFVEGVKFTGRPEKVEDTSNISDSSNIASDSNIITGPKTNKTRASKNAFASRTLGRAAGAAILVGASFLVNAVKRKKNDK